MAKIRILLTGGGSGGHVYPLLAVKEALERTAVAKGLELDLWYMGPRDQYSEVLLAQGVQAHWLLAGKLRRYASGTLANLIDVPKILIGFLQAAWKMFWLMPGAVFSKGGPGALPVVCAAWFYRIPILVHDSDAAPGLTTLLTSRFAKRIAISFEQAARFFPSTKVILTGNPIRSSLFARRQDPKDDKKKLGFDENTPLLLVLGGSQGSTRINEFVVVNLKEILLLAQVFHQTGTENYLETNKLAQASMSDLAVQKAITTRYQALPFLDENYASALNAADVVAARAGSSTIFEIAGFGKPAILIPLLESANNHQRANAYAFAEAGGAVVVEENNLLPGIFTRQLKQILEDQGTREKMQKAATGFFKPDAANKLADLILELAG